LVGVNNINVIIILKELFRFVLRHNIIVIVVIVVIAVVDIIIIVVAILAEQWSGNSGNDSSPTAADAIAGSRKRTASSHAIECRAGSARSAFATTCGA
jgi:hypothetical protein